MTQKATQKDDPKKWRAFKNLLGHVSSGLWVAGGGIKKNPWFNSNYMVPVTNILFFFHLSHYNTYWNKFWMRIHITVWSF